MSVCPAAPSASPTNIIGTALSPESIRFTWEPPLVPFQNGLIRSYKIMMTENQTGITTQHSTSLTQITLTSLHAYYLYEFVVTAVTVSPGPMSHSVTVQTPPDGMMNHINFPVLLATT